MLSCFTVGFVSGVGVSLALMLVIVGIVYVVMRNRKGDRKFKPSAYNKIDSHIEMGSLDSKFVIEEEEELPESALLSLDPFASIDPNVFQEQWLSIQNE